ncbi:hypothetical protein HA402_011389 [Bradysia odoriphaga]|nr:hypothetical protein HA402_011389 [Bradysia odoriphaga]
MIALFRTKSVLVTQQCVRYALPIGKLNKSLTGGYVYCCDVTESNWKTEEFELRFSISKQGACQRGKSTSQELRQYVVYGSGDKDSTKSVNVPPTSKEIPNKVPYLVIGGGTASFAAFRAIKSHDPKAKVMVITRENQMPYMRPPLSKEIWRNWGSDLKFKQWNGAERSLFFEPEDFYIDPTKLLESQNGGLAIVRGYTVKSIDVAAKKVILSDGTEIEYDECLLAPDSEPENLPILRLVSPAILFER